MPAIVRIGDMSTGHSCFPPTPMAVSPVSKTFINGVNPGVVDSGSQHVAHSCGNTVHPNSTRTHSSGSSNTFIEGKPAARIGDNISCGDAVGQGSPNTFVGG